MKITCGEFTLAYESEKGPKVILDVREPDEVNQGAIKGSINIPVAMLQQRYREIPADKKIFIHCRSGKRAQTAYQTLATLGFKNLVCIAEGGYDDLKHSISL